MNAKAIIIGAGISGLASAVALKSIGYDVVLNEKSPTLKSGGAGVTLWNNAWNALTNLGAAGSLYAKGKIITDSDIITSSGKVLSNIPLSQYSKKYGGHTVGMLRSQLYSVLLEQLSSVPIHTTRKLIRTEQYENKGSFLGYFIRFGL